VGDDTACNTSVSAYLISAGPCWIRRLLQRPPRPITLRASRYRTFSRRWAFCPIPRDPLAAEFRQGNTLGRERRHWFRAKFGGNRFRLFFRADFRARVIVYAWVNDRDTLRKAGASSDPYAVFAGMLAGGNPPDDWPALLAAAQTDSAVQRLGRADKATEDLT